MGKLLYLLAALFLIVAVLLLVFYMVTEVSYGAIFIALIFIIAILLGVLAYIF